MFQFANINNTNRTIVNTTFVERVRYQTICENKTLEPYDTQSNFSILQTLAPYYVSAITPRYCTNVSYTVNETMQFNQTDNNSTELSWEEYLKKKKHEYLNEENVKVGLMFSSKAFVQLICNHFIGPLTNR